MNKTEYYISLDIEADGPCPGLNSMLQIGAVFYDETGKSLLEFTENLKELDDARSDPETMKWWAEQEKKTPGIWGRMTASQVPAQTVMERFQKAVERINGLTGGLPVVIAYPLGYDFVWLYWYLCKFFGRSCVGFSALDIKTLAMSLLKCSYRAASKKNWPKQWRSLKLKHTHSAIDDAREQGYSFWKMIQECR